MSNKKEEKRKRKKEEFALCLYNKNKTSPSVSFMGHSDIYGHISCGYILGHE